MPFRGWNPLTYIHLCHPSPALRKGTGTGTGPLLHRAPGSSSRHPLCPLHPSPRDEVVWGGECSEPQATEGRVLASSKARPHTGVTHAITTFFLTAKL